MSEFEMNDEVKQRALAALPVLLAAGDDLLNASHLRLPAANRRVVAAAYSWWRLVHRQAAAVLLLEQNGYVANEAAPLMRNIFNHAYAVHWLIDNGDDAVEALTRAGMDDRDKLAAWLTKTEWPGADEYKSLVDEYKADNPLPTYDATTEERIRGLMSELGNVALLFERYGELGVYPVYSHLSSLSHTSMSTSSLYLSVDPETGEEGIRSVATDAGQGSSVHLALALLQVDSAFSPLLTGDPLRAAVDQVLADLGLDGAKLLPERARQAEAKEKNRGRRQRK